jgi:hypothetical protein
MARCTWNRKLDCWITEYEKKDFYCPRSDRNRDFIDHVEEWVSNHTSTGDGGGTGDRDFYLAKLADTYRLFDEGSNIIRLFDETDDFALGHCRDLVRGRLLWLRINTGQTYKNAVQKVDKIMLDIKK